jgi:dihydroxy-acid dehydratase
MTQAKRGGVSALLGVEGRPTSYADPGFSRFLRRAFLASAGYDDEDLADRPVVGIADTSSDYVTCHRDMPELVAAVRRGVLEAGGIPLTFPTISLGEILISPTSMLFRNLMAMETEEMLLALPMDAAVLLGGCDKTIPGQLMAAASADLPTLALATGPMPTGGWRGNRLGACTDCRRSWARYRAGELTPEELTEIESALCPSGGTCMVMGTASTMACVAEALGMALPGSATPISGSGDRLRMAVRAGRQAVRAAREGLRPSLILQPAAFRNALVVLSALGGSTNAIIHLTAIARRAGIDLPLDEFDLVSRAVPVLVDCKPTGSGYLEDFHRAGGVPALMKGLESLLDLSAIGVDGARLGSRLRDVPMPPAWQRTIRGLDDPVTPAGSLAVLHGSLAPAGAVLKVGAASGELLQHRGPALVFDSPDEAARRLDDPSLSVSAGHVLVLRNAGPVGAGMPEAGSLPLPRRLAEAGLRDMVRVSDARMSGTAYGTVVLHCSPEAAIGGPLALVRDGDQIDLNVAERRIDLLVEPGELARRRASWVAPVLPDRGWRRLHATSVMQAELGADLDFLSPSRPLADL